MTIENLINVELNPAVLIIDMQIHFIGVQNTARDIIIPAQLNVVNYCAQKDIPVIKIEFESKLYHTINELNDACRLVPRTELVRKYDCDAFDMFTKPDLDLILKNLSINYVVLMGVYAGGCVEITAQSALAKGYKIGTATDLIADHREVLPSNGLFMEDKSVKFYQTRGNLFNNHQELIKYLEGVK